MQRKCKDQTTNSGRQVSRPELSDDKSIPQKKKGRPAGVSITDYNKEIIKQNNERERNIKERELYDKLSCLFYSIYNKYNGVLFWLPLQNEQVTNFSIFSLFDESALRSYVEQNVYRLTGTGLVFERINYPEGVFCPPRVTYSLTDFIRRIFSTQPENAAAFLNPDAHRDFIMGAKREARKYKNVGDASVTILSNCSWILKDIERNPERYSYNKTQPQLPAL